MYQRTMTGPAGRQVKGMPDLRARELWAVGPLIALIIGFGFYPKPVLDVINPAVHQTLSQVHDHRTRQPDRIRRRLPEGKHPVTGRPGRGRRARGHDPAPHIEYGQLAPMLLVFGAAVVGVLVEAFAPRDLRRRAHLVLTLGGLAAAFVLDHRGRRDLDAVRHGSAGHVGRHGRGRRWTGRRCSSRARSSCSRSSACC